jgi:hypothetical protein
MNNLNGSITELGYNDDGTLFRVKSLPITFKMLSIDSHLYNDLHITVFNKDKCDKLLDLLNSSFYLIEWVDDNKKQHHYYGCFDNYQNNYNDQNVVLKFKAMYVVDSGYLLSKTDEPPQEVDDDLCYVHNIFNNDFVRGLLSNPIVKPHSENIKHSNEKFSDVSKKLWYMTANISRQRDKEIFDDAIKNNGLTFYAQDTPFQLVG